MKRYREDMIAQIEQLADIELQDVRIPPYHWTPFKGGIIGACIALSLTMLCVMSCETQTTVPKANRLNEPCHYGAKPVMVEDGASVGKHRVVCGCPQ